MIAEGRRFSLVSRPLLFLPVVKIRRKSCSCWCEMCACSCLPCFKARRSIDRLTELKLTRCCVEFLLYCLALAGFHSNVTMHSPFWCPSVQKSPRDGFVKRVDAGDHHQSLILLRSGTGADFHGPRETCSMHRGDRDQFTHSDVGRRRGDGYDGADAIGGQQLVE